MKVHFTEQYLLSPPHKVTVNLIGLGGTGSQVLTCLARLNETLMGLDHPGLHVRCWDGDSVSDANIGRQLFSPADIGQNKTVLLAGRVNRFFGYEWEGNPEHFEGQTPANITVTCIDSAAGRLKVSENLKKPAFQSEPTHLQYYWLDMGNLQKTGQAVLGTVQRIKQPKSQHETASTLPHVVKVFPELEKITEDDQGPSCSLAQAINRQDLFINSILANLGVNLLWKLFREGMVRHHGCFVNLETGTVNPIVIK